MRRPWKRSKEPSTGPPEAGRTEWVRITIAPNRMVAGMLAGALDSEGIPHFEKKLGFDMPTVPSNQTAIMVPLEHKERATQVLSSISEIRE